MTGHEASEAVPCGAVDRDDGQCKAKRNQADEAPPAIYEEAWKQLRLARYRIPAPEMMTMHGEPSEGHDAFADRALACQ